MSHLIDTILVIYNKEKKWKKWRLLNNNPQFKLNATPYYLRYQICKDLEKEQLKEGKNDWFKKSNNKWI